MDKSSSITMCKDEIIEAGLNGRTTTFDDPYNEHRNGRKTLPVLLKQHQPLDMLIIMLGTNDLKTFFMPVNLLLRKEYENLFVSHAILIFMNSIINLQKF